MHNVVDMKIYIPAIYDSGFNDKRFQFLNVESLSKEDQKSLTEYCEGKTRPEVEGFDNIVFTWDYFKWLREKDNINESEDVVSINKRGIGYCNHCGKKTSFTLYDNLWQCDRCGSFNTKIFCRSVERLMYTQSIFSK